jgi:hypothetical protein
MIVNWTKDNLKIIPAHIPTKEEPSATTNFVTLPPGYSEVRDVEWAQARYFVQQELTDGLIIEEWTKAPRPDKEEDLPLIWCDMEDKRENKAMRIPSTIRDIQRPAVIERVVKNTFHMPTLQKWSAEENRADVQTALQAQIKAVEKGEIVG